MQPYPPAESFLCYVVNAPPCVLRLELRKPKGKGRKIKIEG
jgi:hypothetical protein